MGRCGDVGAIPETLYAVTGRQAQLMSTSRMVFDSLILRSHEAERYCQCKLLRFLDALSARASALFLSQPETCIAAPAALCQAPVSVVLSSRCAIADRTVLRPASPRIQVTLRPEKARTAEEICHEARQGQDRLRDRSRGGHGVGQSQIHASSPVSLQFLLCERWLRRFVSGILCIAAGFVNPKNLINPLFKPKWQ